MEKMQFAVGGMTCSACSARVDKAVAALAGVDSISVNLLKNSMLVSYDPQQTGPDLIAEAVSKAGYSASPQVQAAGGEKQAALQSPDQPAAQIRELKFRLIVSAIFTIPLFYISMGHMLGLPLPSWLSGQSNALVFAFTQFLLTLPVVIVNSKYYRVGFKTLLSGAPNMDSLIAIGSGAAVVYGILTIYKIAAAFGQGDLAMAHHFAMNLYFESAAMILTLITLGKYFEAKAKGKTSDAIAKLISLVPKTATVLRNGVEASIAAEQVQVGDTVVVKAGESIPVDGVLLEGHAVVDEAAITGESAPVDKLPGAALTGATINKSGHFLMRATRVGDNTTLAQIVKLVDEATSSKAPIARLADKISGVFVPVVITIALGAAAFWLLKGYGTEFALTIGISVLVISCPCALGLATPTAIMVGSGRGAANGILFKSAEAIELAQAVDTVVLDKTGTVTEGKPVLTDLVPVAGVESDYLLGLAATLEKLSEHPLGAAIVKAAEQKDLPLGKVADFLQTPGQGISGTINGQNVLAGNAKMLAAQVVSIDPALQTQAAALANQGKTALFIAENSQVLGLVAVADVIKPTSAQAVAELQAMGLDVIMLTGDNERTAAAIQQQAGIARVRAEVLPGDKEQEIRAIQEQGRKVAMVGDGINDAPALARADVGLAIGAGTDIAIESADVVLMKSDLLDAATAIQLSRAVMRNIRQNLFWAFFYNIIGIPIAAGVLYPAWGITLNPMIAAAAMSLSSVSVVSNALRLRGFTPKRLAAASPIVSPADGQNPENTIRRTTMHKTIKINGMNCGHCTASVEKALKAVPGVQEVKVSLEAKNAIVEGEASEAALKDAVTGAGFEVADIY